MGRRIRMLPNSSLSFRLAWHAGHVHCMLSWSSNATSGWRWVDKGGLQALKEFIPARPAAIPRLGLRTRTL